jgi:hypothetical protein
MPGVGRSGGTTGGGGRSPNTGGQHAAVAGAVDLNGRSRTGQPIEDPEDRDVRVVDRVVGVQVREEDRTQALEAVLEVGRPQPSAAVLQPHALTAVDEVDGAVDHQCRGDAMADRRARGHDPDGAAGRAEQHHARAVAARLRRGGERWRGGSRTRRRRRYGRQRGRAGGAQESPPGHPLCDRLSDEVAHRGSGTLAGAGAHVKAASIAAIRIGQPELSHDGPPATKPPAPIQRPSRRDRFAGTVPQRRGG